jgi:hypothetical protein
MHIDFEISEQDFLDAQRLATKNSSLRIVRWTRLVLPLFGLSLLIFLIHGTATQGFSVRLIPGLAVCLFFISVPLLNRRTQKKLYAKSTAMHGRLSLDADDDGMQFGGQTFSSKMSWSHFGKFFEDEKVFVLYQQNQRVFSSVPKRTLSPEQITTLRQYLQRNVSSGGSKPATNGGVQPPQRV